MTVEPFKEWARVAAKAHNWSLDLLTTERDGVIVACEAWFCTKDDRRKDTAQGYWKDDGRDVATF